MKICSKCGIQNSDLAAFCSSCGTALTENSQQTNPNNNPSGQQFGQPMGYNQFGQGQYLSPVISAVKSLGSSVLFLSAIIIYTVSLLFSGISSFSNTTSDISFYKYDVEYYEEIIKVLEKLLPYITAFSLIVIAPSILFCIGMWQFYNASRNPTDAPLSTSGLKLIKISSIISLASLALIPIFIIYLIINISTIVDTGYSSIVTATLIGFIIGILLILVLPVFYYIGIIKIAKTITNTILTGVPSNDISGFVIVMNYIMGGFSLLSLSTGGIGALLNASFFILISIGLTQYKKTMTQLIYNNYYTNTPT
ncbi:MAG: hypothetical protein A2Y15_06330 [Clostridiales bacterium GWF2_36_10]|nr:MAG: hypothetical protein A2Y15_06330 [Clostridiales bacterium GWF2_36_10]HAN21865.1 hypothetical protein [Clostridiales bacterium]